LLHRERLLAFVTPARQNFSPKLRSRWGSVTHLEGMVPQIADPSHPNAAGMTIRATDFLFRVSLNHSSFSLMASGKPHAAGQCQNRRGNHPAQVNTPFAVPGGKTLSVFLVIFSGEAGWQLADTADRLNY
jgi:hypothetical protein